MRRVAPRGARPPLTPPRSFTVGPFASVVAAFLPIHAIMCATLCRRTTRLPTLPLINHIHDRLAHPRTCLQATLALAVWLPLFHTSSLPLLCGMRTVLTLTAVAHAFAAGFTAVTLADAKGVAGTCAALVGAILAFASLHTFHAALALPSPFTLPVRLIAHLVLQAAKLLAIALLHLAVAVTLVAVTDRATYDTSQLAGTVAAPAVAAAVLAFLCAQGADQVGRGHRHAPAAVAAPGSRSRLDPHAQALPLTLLLDLLRGATLPLPWAHS